ncbi:hypothetical protein ZWY2020_020722 [Hordeum vulgare]|nr:hypothetical protein ZWY2020_020722 [Hordeum vulgare]
MHSWRSRSHMLITCMRMTHRSTARFLAAQQCRDQAEVPLSLSLTLSAMVDRISKKQRRDADGEFVCKTCSRAFPSFHVLGGHGTSRLHGRHGLALGLTAGSDEPAIKKTTDQKH